MIKENNISNSTQNIRPVIILRMTFIGLLMGLIMGLLGAGGGFLIIPTLVLLLGIEMKQAVSTSLFIITLNSTTGFFADRHPMDAAHYKMLLFFTGLSLCGMWLGTYVGSNISSDNLKKGFGWFIAVVAVMITIKEIYFS